MSEPPPQQQTPPDRLEPPHSMEAERSVLGLVIVNGHLVSEASALLGKEDFFHYGHALIWQAVVTVYYEAGAVDTTTLVAYLRDNGQLEDCGGLFAVTNIVTEHAGMPSMLRRYVRIIRDHAQRRKLMSLAADVSRRAADGAQAVDGVLDGAFASLLEQFSGSERHDPIVLGDLLADARRRVTDAAGLKRRWAGLDTGFPALNDAMNGLCQDELTIIGARPGVGKTRLALQICRNIIHSGQGGALVFSLEMSRSQLVDYLICLETGINLSQFRRGELTPAEWAQYGRVEQMMAEWDLVLDDSPGLSMSELYAITERVRRLHKDKIKLVVIDYLQLMNGPGSGGNEKFDRLSQGLKDYSKSISLPVLLLSQCSRNVDARADRRPCMADLRDSGQIEANAVNVLMLWRMGAYPELLDRTGYADETKQHACIVADKLRFGTPQEIPLKWDPNTAMFVNRERPPASGPQARRTR